MILITGATGQLGSLIIKALIKRVPANQIIAAVRDVNKARDLKELGVQVREANYNHPEHWPLALEGVDKVLIITSSEIEKRQEHAMTVINAVKKAGHVKLLAFTSLLNVDKLNSSMAIKEKETEKFIRDTSIPSVMLRHTWYTENYADFAQNAAETGVLYGSAKDGKISGATRADLAEAAAEILTKKGALKSAYELAGDAYFTLSDVAAEISKQSGKVVNYVDIPEAQLRDYFLQIGYPADVAKILAEADTAVANGDLYNDTNELSHLIGRKTTSLFDAVNTALNKSHTKEY